MTFFQISQQSKRFRSQVNDTYEVLVRQKNKTKQTSLKKQMTKLNWQGRLRIDREYCSLVVNQPP